MPKNIESRIAVVALIFFAFWLFVVLPFLYVPEKPLKCAENLSFWQKTNCDPTAYFSFWLMIWTAMLGVATIGLGIATVGLYRTGERQLRHMVRNAKQQDKNLRILQRAYISVQPGGIAARSGDCCRCHAIIEIKNAGNLPARNVTWTAAWEIDENRHRNHFDINEKSAVGENTLSPGTEMMQTVGDMICVGNGPNKIEHRAHLFLFVFGVVLYEDGFGVHQKTFFCHRYNCVNLKPILDNDHKVVVGHRIDKEFARLVRTGNNAT